MDVHHNLLAVLLGDVWGRNHCLPSFLCELILADPLLSTTVTAR